MAKFTKKPVEEEAASVKGGKEVELSSLSSLQEFKYKGQSYTMRRPTPAGIKALSKDGGKLLFLPPDTLVTPL